MTASATWSTSCPSDRVAPRVGQVSFRQRHAEIAAQPTEHVIRCDLALRYGDVLRWPRHGGPVSTILIHQMKTEWFTGSASYSFSSYSAVSAVSRVGGVRSGVRCRAGGWQRASMSHERCRTNRSWWTGRYISRVCCFRQAATSLPAVCPCQQHDAALVAARGA
jgi:hypothetical protein